MTQKTARIGRLGHFGYVLQGVSGSRWEHLRLVRLPQIRRLNLMQAMLPNHRLDLGQDSEGNCQLHHLVQRDSSDQYELA